MKYLMLICAACMCLVACQKKDPHGYAVGQVYEDKHGSQSKAVDAEPDYNNILWLNGGAYEWTTKNDTQALEILEEGGWNSNQLKLWPFK